MNKPEVWNFQELLAYNFKKGVVWTRPYLRSKLEGSLPLPVIEDSEEPPVDLDTLVVVGGGVLIDRAKIWRKENNPNIKLIAIPSIWGSGTENSPIAVLNLGEKKVFQTGDQYLPDARVVWSALSEGLPANLVRYACGDVWAHALEGFLSPIAKVEVRDELATVMKSLITLPFENDSRWFESSARACAGQARSSVGLIHGIAHVLEGLLRQKYPDKRLGHARLCATFLWPVISLCMTLTGTIDTLFAEYGLGKGRIIEAIEHLFEEETYRLALPILEENWRSVLREPSTRTNCVLVRAGDVSHFVNRKF